MTEARKVRIRFQTDFNTAALRKGLNAINRVKTALQTLAGAAGLGIAIRRFSQFVTQVSTANDLLAKGARTIDFSKKAFQEWLFTIELAGGSYRSFAKYVFFVQRGVGEAAAGLKTYSDAFDALNLDPKKLMLLPAEEQFNKVFEALGKVEHQSERNRISQRILGRGGRELVVAIKEGYEAHQRNAKLLKLVGGVIEKDILRRMELWVDRTIVLRKALEAFRARTLNALLDVLEPLMDRFIQLWGVFNRLTKTSNVLRVGMLLFTTALVAFGAYLLVALAPVLKILAALFLLFIILEDIYTGLTGGKSVISDWLKEWTGVDLKEIADYWSGLLTNLKQIEFWWKKSGRETLKDMVYWLGKFAKATLVGRLADIGLKLFLKSQGLGDAATVPMTNDQAVPAWTEQGAPYNEANYYAVENHVTLQSQGDVVRDLQRAHSELERRTLGDTMGMGGTGGGGQ